MRFFTILLFIAPLISAATVRVQLDGLDELAIQKEIPTTNVATSFPGSFTDGFITNLEGNNGVTCQAFSDAAGTKAVAGRFGAAGSTFNGGQAVTIGSVKCS